MRRIGPLFQKNLIQLNCFAFTSNQLTLSKLILCYIESLSLPLGKIMPFLNGCHCFKHNVVYYSTFFFQQTPAVTTTNTTTVISK